VVDSASAGGFRILAMRTSRGVMHGMQAQMTARLPSTQVQIARSTARPDIGCLDLMAAAGGVKEGGNVPVMSDGMKWWFSTMRMILATQTLRETAKRQ